MSPQKNVSAYVLYGFAPNMDGKIEKKLIKLTFEAWMKVSALEQRSLTLCGITTGQF